MISQFLALHRIAAERGDGLLPELLNAASREQEQSINRIMNIDQTAQPGVSLSPDRGRVSAQGNAANGPAVESSSNQAKLKKPGYT